MHALTLRLPDPVYQAAKQLAAREGLSLNKLIQEAISERARHSTDQRLRDAYAILAEDAEEADVEKFLAVQAEALLND